MELFGTSGIRGPVRSEVTPSLAVRLGRAAAEDGTEFVVGRDGRETASALAAALAAGLQSGGADVSRLGQLTTPALAYASRGRRGVMVTASHNPPADNGLKFFVDGTEYDRTAERQIESRIETGLSPTEWDRWGTETRSDVIERYRTAVVEYVREELGESNGVHVAVDCGNGTSSLVTPQVLRELGANVTTLNASIDGHFPGRGSKPTAETLGDLRGFVAEGPFDLGIGHDGDGDRIVVTDTDGDVVHEDTVLAIIARHYAETSDASDPVVVTTPNASGRIDEHVEAVGGRTERVRLGGLHEGIAAIEREDDSAIVFAAEPWKHLHPRFGHWIDATVSAGIVAALVADRELAELRSPIRERPYRKGSVDCPDELKSQVMSALETRLPEAFPHADLETKHGVRLTRADGSWTLVRPSGTEPYIRIYAESEAVDEMIDRVTDVVEESIDDAA
jgi:phosphomannomutase